MSAGMITVLGCGNSTGVPAIGNDWGACDPHEPKNIRTRCSIIVECGGTRIVVDTGPDFRAQLNREDIPSVDGVFYTHHHSDHVNGVDELRILYRKNDRVLVPCYGNELTLSDLKVRFPYMFEGGGHALYPSIIAPHILGEAEFGKAQHFLGIDFLPFEQDHGTCSSVGYRFGDFAYSVDLWDLDARGIEALRGIETWLVDGAGYHQEHNPVHANLEKIYALNEQIGATQVYLTSLSLAMDYQTLYAELPEGYAPAYDGMGFEYNSGFS